MSSIFFALCIDTLRCLIITKKKYISMSITFVIPDYYPHLPRPLSCLFHPHLCLFISLSLSPPVSLPLFPSGSRPLWKRLNLLKAQERLSDLICLPASSYPLVPMWNNSVVGFLSLETQPVWKLHCGASSGVERSVNNRNLFTEFRK